MDFDIQFWKQCCSVKHDRMNFNYVSFESILIIIHEIYMIIVIHPGTWLQSIPLFQGSVYSGTHCHLAFNMNHLELHSKEMWGCFLMSEFEITANFLKDWWIQSIPIPPNKCIYYWETLRWKKQNCQNFHTHFCEHSQLQFNFYWLISIAHGSILKC